MKPSSETLFTHNQKIIRYANEAPGKFDMRFKDSMRKLNALANATTDPTTWSDRGAQKKSDIFQ